MPRGAGKGKISNDLVAASCAAVLAVYAAGYSRTREAARKFETQAQERRLALRAQRAAVGGQTPAVKVPAATASVVAALPETSTPVSTPKVRHSSASSAGHGAASGPTAAPRAAEVVPASSGAMQEIAPVPLPAEVASAQVPVTEVPESAAIPAAKWRDGIYTGVGDSPHGDIEARVVIKNGRIIEAGIANCYTRYPCSVIDAILHQPVVLQSPIVDYISHATESSYAYYYGLVDALKQALEQPPGEATGSK